jgi:hypothetical protein
MTDRTPNDKESPVEAAGSDGDAQTPDRFLAEPKVELIAHNLELSDSTLERAEMLARHADTSTEINRTPHVIASGAVYAASLLEDEKRTQAEVQEAGGSSKVAIRDAYQEILAIESIPFNESSSNRNSGTPRETKTRTIQGVPQVSSQLMAHIRQVIR